MAIATVVLAACGSSSTKKSSGGGTPSGKSYSVMVVADVSGTFGFTTPEVIPAVEGAFKGTPVRVLTCDSQGTAPAALNCEHKAVLDKVAAVIVGQSDLAEDQSLLTQAGIPTLGDTDFTSSNSFSLSNGYAPPIGLGLYNAGCRRLGVLYLDGTVSLADGIVQGGTWQSVTKVAVPANAPDLAPAVAKLREGNVQCVALSVIPSEVVQAMIAIKQSGLNAKVAGVSSIITRSVINSLGADANGIIVIGGETNWADTSAPVIQQIKSEIASYSSTDQVSQLAVLDWASAKLVQAAASHIQGAVTAATLLPALNALRNVSTDGAIHPFSAIPLPSKTYARAFNHYVIDYVVKNGQPTALTGFIDLTSVFDKL